MILEKIVANKNGKNIPPKQSLDSMSTIYKFVVTTVTLSEHMRRKPNGHNYFIDYASSKEQDLCF